MVLHERSRLLSKKESEFNTKEIRNAGLLHCRNSAIAQEIKKAFENKKKLLRPGY